MERLLKSEILKKTFSVEIGSRAPDFVLKNEKGNDWQLSEYLGKVVTLLFYPKNETFVCTKQLCSVRDNWKEYLKTKSIIVGISNGTIEAHQKFINRHNLPFPLLADTNRKITKVYTKCTLLPLFLTRAVVVINAKGIICNREILIRPFRPDDQKIISAIKKAQTNSIYQNFMHG